MMNICLIMDNPETSHHTSIGAIWQEWGEKHHLHVLEMQTFIGTQAIADKMKAYLTLEGVRK